MNRNRFTLLTAAAALFTFGLVGIAGADGHEGKAGSAWTIDVAHSQVGFKVKHMMVAWTRGQFHKYDATITYDGKNLKDAHVDVTIDASSIDTNNDKRDEHLRSADFFDVANHPNLTFKSTEIKPGKDGTFRIIGDLTMRGVTKSVTLDVEGGLTPIKDPWGNEKLGFVAEGKIDRTEFGLNWNKALETGGLLVADDVHLVIEVELNKAK